ncbi:hypothetical protein JA1_004950 [Spathaspora sp. JA1]|nr:hypothetical protein JA1_004950 [Spathaspora sp. JA1]
MWFVRQIRKISSPPPKKLDEVSTVQQDHQIKHETTAIRETNSPRSPNKATVMSLPDDVLVDILSRLNQINICRICTVNHRLCMLAKAKLYHSIYINNAIDQPIHIYAFINTPFYRKYTIVNTIHPFEWLHGNSNINLIKNMVILNHDTSLYNVRIIKIKYDSSFAHISNDAVGQETKCKDR